LLPNRHWALSFRPWTAAKSFLVLANYFSIEPIASKRIFSVFGIFSITGISLDIEPVIESLVVIHPSFEFDTGQGNAGKIAEADLSLRIRSEDAVTVFFLEEPHSGAAFLAGAAR